MTLRNGRSVTVIDAGSSRAASLSRKVRAAAWIAKSSARVIARAIKIARPTVGQFTADVEHRLHDPLRVRIGDEPGGNFHGDMRQPARGVASIRLDASTARYIARIRIRHDYVAPS